MVDVPLLKCLLDIRYSSIDLFLVTESGYICGCEGAWSQPSAHLHSYGAVQLEIASFVLAENLFELRVFRWDEYLGTGFS